MTDLVKRLRDWQNVHPEDQDKPEGHLYEEAANRIEALEAGVANAHLIAAAPDLLEALEAAVECGLVPKSSASDGSPSRYSRQVVVADMIRAAIAKAKAKGEE